jgi:hypothetical protein
MCRTPPGKFCFLSRFSCDAISADWILTSSLAACSISLPSTAVLVSNEPAGSPKSSKTLSRSDSSDANVDERVISDASVLSAWIGVAGVVRGRCEGLEGLVWVSESTFFDRCC